MRRTLFSAALMLLVIPVAVAGQERPEPPEVFTPPPGDELASITHHDLRLEMLWMAYEDQEARRRGG